MDMQRVSGAQVGSGMTQSALKKTGRALEKVLERLATAQRINRASDDAAGLALSEQLRSQVRGFRMASNNASDAVSALNIADGTTNEVGSMLQRQRELALQARNDTLTDTQRQALNVEYQQLNQEMGRIASNAQFNTQGVTAGQGLASGAAQIQAGPNAGDSITMPQIDVTSVALGVSGTSIDTAANATAALTSIDTAIDSLSSQRSTIGAMTNRLVSSINNLSVSEINTQAAESVLRDQDFAQGIMELSRERLLNEGGIRAFSRFQDISANHLMSLLQ